MPDLNKQPFSLDWVQSALTSDHAIAFADIHTTRAVVDDKIVWFCNNIRRDPIQEANRNGLFYEPEELAIMANVFPEDGTFVDIGANIGNHTLFAAIFMKAGKVIPFEPNIQAYRMLVANVFMNRLEHVVDLAHLGVGVGAEDAGGYGVAPRKKKLGGARMIKGEGELRVVRGDDALSDLRPDLIKIDVEGMEMEVLAGLEQTVMAHRPKIFVEVDRHNDDLFHTWAKKFSYDIVDKFKRYHANINYLAVPIET